MESSQNDDSHADAAFVPHPNPYFPPPPRRFDGKERHWRNFCKWGWIVLTPAGVVSTWLFFGTYMDHIADEKIRLCIALFTMGLIVVGPVFYVAGSRFRAWEVGQILPALVVWSAPPRKLEWYEIILALGVTIVGGGSIITELKDTGAYKVRYVIAGRVCERTVRIRNVHAHCEVGDVIWAAVRGRKAKAILQEAPEELRNTPVPPEVKSAVVNALRDADPTQLKKAAKAAKQEDKRAQMYDKRPD